MRRPIFERVILFLYPLRGEHLAKVQAQVLAMHAEKHARLAAQQEKPVQVGQEGLATAD